MRFVFSIIYLRAALGLMAMAAEENAMSIKPEAVRIAKDAGLGIEVFALRDRETEMTPGDFLLDAAPEDIATHFPYGRTMSTTTVFLIKWGKQNVLVDAGIGQIRGGALLQSLALAGVAPENVNAILITSLGYNHIGGLEYDGEAVFPEARIYLMKDELNAWTTIERKEALPEFHRERAESLSHILALYQERVIAMAPDHAAEMGWVPHQDKFPVYWMHSQSAPRHANYVITRGRGDKPLIIFAGAIVHFPDMQTINPEIMTSLDIDPERAKAMRKQIFAAAEKAKYRIAGSHFPFPSAGTLKKRGDGYEFHLINYSRGPKNAAE